MKILLTIPVLFSSIFLFQGGCGTTMIDCSNEQLAFTTVGYSTEELTDVIVRRYERESNYTTLIDSIWFRLSPGQYTPDSDTLPLTTMRVINHLSGYNGIEQLNATVNHDYEIFIMKTGATYRISNVKDQQNYTQEVPRSGHESCNNFIVSYNLDGNEIINQMGSGSVYLSK